MKNIVDTMNAQEGDKLPVSAFNGRKMVHSHQFLQQHMKNVVFAVDVPEWQPDKCIQCNQCSYVCPHAFYSSILVVDGEEEVKA